MKTTVSDCYFVDLSTVVRPEGDLTIVEEGKDIAFKIKRAYYLYNVPYKATRGSHGHKELKQFMVAISGSFDVILDDGLNKRTVILDDPTEGLFIPNGIWGSLCNFSTNAICIVFASHLYSEDDYIRDYNNFLTFKAW